jgi:hypothetical protein
MSYLKEENGQSSSMRIMFVIGLAWSMLVSTALTYSMQWTAGEFIAVFTATSGIFTGAKIAQKSLETKNK